MKRCDLKRHAKAHTEESLNKCDFCSKAFDETGHLSDHEGFHTEESPFKCDSCKKALPQSGQLLEVQT